jgi:hypothetical protein
VVVGPTWIVRPLEPLVVKVPRTTLQSAVALNVPSDAKAIV